MYLALVQAAPANGLLLCVWTAPTVQNIIGSKSNSGVFGASAQSAGMRRKAGYEKAAREVLLHGSMPTPTEGVTSSSARSIVLRTSAP